MESWPDPIKEVRTAPARIFEVFGMDMRQHVVACLSQFMDVERTHALDPEEYERTDGPSDHKERQLREALLDEKELSESVERWCHRDLSHWGARRLRGETRHHGRAARTGKGPFSCSLEKNGYHFGRPTS